MSAARAPLRWSCGDSPALDVSLAFLQSSPRSKCRPCKTVERRRAPLREHVELFIRESETCREEFPTSVNLALQSSEPVHRPLKFRRGFHGPFPSGKVGPTRRHRLRGVNDAPGLPLTRSRVA